MQIASDLKNCDVQAVGQANTIPEVHYALVGRPQDREVVRGLHHTR